VYVVHLAGEEGGHPRVLVRHPPPLEEVDLHDLAAGETVGRLGPRLVVGELLVDGVAVDHSLLDLERPRTRHVGELLVGGRAAGDALGHDEKDDAVGRRERVDEQPERPREANHEGLLVPRLDRRQPVQNLLAHLGDLRPALDRGDAVGRRDVRAIVELQAVAQDEGVDEAVAAPVPRVDHLRMRLQLVVDAEQLVVDQERVVAGPVGVRVDRVDDAHVHAVAEAHHDRSRLRGLRGGVRDGPRSRAQDQPRQGDPEYPCHVSVLLASGRVQSSMR
jgi:hypothetical protein